MPFNTFEARRQNRPRNKWPRRIVNMYEIRSKLSGRSQAIAHRQGTRFAAGHRIHQTAIVDPLGQNIVIRSVVRMNDNEHRIHPVTLQNRVQRAFQHWDTANGTILFGDANSSPGSTAGGNDQRGMAHGGFLGPDASL